MLTIAYVFFALQLLAAGSPSPPRAGVQRIALTRRQPHNTTVPADLKRIAQQADSTMFKYNVGFDAYKEVSGKDHPLADGPANNTKRATGTQNLVDVDGALYVGQMSAGTPPQQFTVGFDTGSASLFLVNAACTSTDCQNHHRYNPSISTTATNRKKNFSLKVASSDTVSGSQYTDTVSVNDLVATNQVLGASNTYPTSFNSFSVPPDGRVGMAYQSISAYNAPSLPQTLVAQGATTDPVFAFRLDANPELTLGGMNPSAYQGDITYAPVTTKAFWQINLDSVQANGQRSVGRTPAIIDTGSPFIIGDPVNVQKFYATIPGSKAIGNGIYTFPCASDPEVAITVAGTAFTIPVASFDLGPISQGSDQCVGAIMAAPRTKPPQRYWSIGAAFLSNVYSVFDFGGNQVGFAELCR